MALDKLRTASGRRLRGEALTETALPVPYDAAAMPGAIVLGTDGRLYGSVRNPASAPFAWQSLPASGTEVVDVTGNIKTSDTFIGVRLEIGGGRSNFVIGLGGGGTEYKPSLQVEGLNPQQASITLTRTSTEAGAESRLILARSRGTALGDTAVVENGDTIAQILFSGADGTSIIPGIAITARVDGTPATDSVPMHLIVRTPTLGERVRVAANGNIQINNTTGTERLSVTGNIQVTEATDGFHVGANQVLGSRQTGWAAPTGTATRTTFVTSTVTTEQLAERVKALLDDLTTHGLIGT
jgi:hypothetical protein